MSEKKTAIVTKESQSGRYVVIEIRRNQVFHKRFVISFHDEEALREIAAPSISGIGFSFRRAAVAVIPNNSLGDADSENTREERAFTREDDSCRPQSSKEHWRHSVGPTKIRGIAYATLQNALAAGILMFYARSVLGAVIRAVVGA